MVKIIKILIFLNLINVFAAGYAIALEAQNENTANIKNKIETRVETGANISGDGESNEGNSSAQIKIKTEINGNIVTDINESKKERGNMDIGIENEVKADSLNVDVKTYIYGSEGSGIKEDTIELNNAATDNINLSSERTDHKNEEYGFSDIEEQIGNEQEREVAIVQNSDTGNNGLLNVVLTFLTGLKNKIINFFI